MSGVTRVTFDGIECPVTDPLTYQIALPGDVHECELVVEIMPNSDGA